MSKELTPNQRIKDDRAGRKMSQTEYGEFVGLPQNAISRIERGIIVWADAAVKISRATGIPLDDLYPPETAGVVSE